MEDELRLVSAETGLTDRGRPVGPVRGFAPDQICFSPIGHEPAASTYQTQVLWSSPPLGSVVDTASDSIASKIPRSPTRETENPTPMEPMV